MHDLFVLCKVSQKGVPYQVLALRMGENRFIYLCFQVADISEITGLSIADIRNMDVNTMRKVGNFNAVK